MSTTDRVIRVLVSIVFAVLYFTGTVTGTLGLVLLVAAIIFTFTSITSFCPIYAALGISSCPTVPAKK